MASEKEMQGPRVEYQGVPPVLTKGVSSSGIRRQRCKVGENLAGVQANDRCEEIRQSETEALFPMVEHARLG